MGEVSVVGLEWLKHGPCRENPDRQYPGWDAEGIRLAKQVCAGCTVRAECLDLALTNNENEGIWGGLTPTERARLKDGGKEPCPTCGRLKGLTVDGLIELHKSNSRTVCSGSGSKP